MHNRREKLKQTCETRYDEEKMAMLVSFLPHCFQQRGERRRDSGFVRRRCCAAALQGDAKEATL